MSLRPHIGPVAPHRGGEGGLSAAPGEPLRLVLPPGGPLPASLLDSVVAALESGRLALLPSDTCYILAALATHPEAVAAAYAAKGRTPARPMHVVLSGASQAARWTRLSPAARRLATRLWPGPLTLILPLRRPPAPGLYDLGRTLGVRVPASPLLRSVCRRLGAPLTASSANPAGGATPYTVQQAVEGFGGAPPWALAVDGGPLPEGSISTLAEVRGGGGVRILRRGATSEAAILAALAAAPGRPAHR